MSILERRKAKAAAMCLTAPIAALGVSGFAGSSARGAMIGSTDVLFFQSGTTASPDAAGGSPLLIDDLSTSNNTLVQQFNITNITGNSTSPTSSTLYSNSNGSNGQLALSDNNTLVTFGGYQGYSSSNELQQNTRQAVSINSNGVVTTGGANGTYGEFANGAATGQVRSAFTFDGANYTFSDKSGVYTGGTNGAANGTNIRFLAGFGGTLYALAQANNSTASFFTYSSGTLSPVSGVGNNGTFNNATNFVFLQSGVNGNAYDTLYVANQTAILKYDYNGTSLTSEGQDTITPATNTGNIADLTALELGGNTVDIYFTTKGDTSPVFGTVEELTDSSGWNGTLSNTTPTVLYTAPAGADLFGITTAPAAVVATPEPASASLLALGGLGLLRRRRRRSGAT